MNCIETIHKVVRSDFLVMEITLDWNEIIRSKKKVKARDKIPCGNVIAEYKDSIIVLDGEVIVSHEYMIPKSKVDNYNGRELFLNIPYKMLLNFDF
jgi:hypothetical protein